MELIPRQNVTSQGEETPGEDDAGGKRVPCMSPITPPHLQEVLSVPGVPASHSLSALPLQLGACTGRGPF